MPNARLQDGGDALQAHAGVNMLRGQHLEAAVGLAVELDENVVPDLQHVRVVCGVQRAGPLGGVTH